MDGRPTQTPEGKLIQDAANRDPRSIRQLSANARISDARWRQIVAGYRSEGHGRYVPIVANPDTLARMAAVVGVTADQLREAGRADAADSLASGGSRRKPPTEGHLTEMPTAAPTLAEQLRRIRESDMPLDHKLLAADEVIAMYVREGTGSESSDAARSHRSAS